MPVTVKRVGGVLRIVEVSTMRIARSKTGKPVDGGRAHARQRGDRMAYTQAGHINDGIAKRKGT